MMAQDPVKHFNPPAPCGAGRRPAPAGRTAGRNFNPPAPCGAGLLSATRESEAKADFNPPAPCGAGLGLIDVDGHNFPFQSTRPVRGGTGETTASDGDFPYFNPPAPCGAGRERGTAAVTGRHDFNPPAPCGAGHCNRPLPRYGGKISIHPPRAGRDQGHSHKDMAHICIFQSTRPVRGGTKGAICSNVLASISIHPPRAGRDLIVLVVGLIIKRFQSTRPVRGGTSRGGWLPRRSKHFNPPAPCGAGQQSCTKFTPCILAQYTIQRAAKLLFAYQQAYFC